MAVGIEVGQELAFVTSDDESPRSFVPYLKQLFDVDPYLKTYRTEIERRYDRCFNLLCTSTEDVLNLDNAGRLFSACDLQAALPLKRATSNPLDLAVFAAKGKLLEMECLISKPICTGASWLGKRS
jgi:hypothetical protein